MASSFVFISHSSEGVFWWSCTDGPVWTGLLFHLVGNIVSNGFLKRILLTTWLRAGDFGSVAISVLMKESLYLLVIFFLSPSFPFPVSLCFPPPDPCCLPPPSCLTVTTWVGCLRREVKCGKLRDPVGALWRFRRLWCSPCLKCSGQFLSPQISLRTTFISFWPLLPRIVAER